MTEEKFYKRIVPFLAAKDQQTNFTLYDQQLVFFKTPVSCCCDVCRCFWGVQVTHL